MLLDSFHAPGAPPCAKPMPFAPTPWLKSRTDDSPPHATWAATGISPRILTPLSITLFGSAYRVILNFGVATPLRTRSPTLLACPKPTSRCLVGAISLNRYTSPGYRNGNGPSGRSAVDPHTNPPHHTHPPTPPTHPPLPPRLALCGGHPSAPPPEAVVWIRCPRAASR